MKIENNWWTYNAVWHAIIGLISLGLGSIFGLLDLLIGVALLQKSNIVYWIVFMVTIVSFVGGLLSYSKNPIGFVFSLISMVLIYFLSKERQGNKLKK